MSPTHSKRLTAAAQLQARFDERNAANLNVDEYTRCLDGLMQISNLIRGIPVKAMTTIVACAPEPPHTARHIIAAYRTLQETLDRIELDVAAEMDHCHVPTHAAPMVKQ